MARSLPIRLYTGLTIAVVLVFVVGFITINSLEKQTSESEMVRHTHRVISRVNDIRFTITQIRSSRRAYWVTGAGNDMDAYEKGVSFIPNRLSSLNELVGDNAGQAMNVMRLDSLITDLMRFWRTTGQISPQIDQDRFRSIVIEEEKKLVPILHGIERVKLLEEELLAKREAIVAEYKSRTKWMLYIGIGILMLVVLVLINAVIQTLKSRHKAGLRLQATLEETERINRMAQEKNWVLEGMSYINNRLQVVDSSSELAHRIINAVVQYMEVPAGVVYFMDEKGEKLITAASVAVSASSSKSFNIGEGVVGNAALAKTVSVIRNIPPDYWQVDSALGKVTGNGEIACIPLWMNDELKGLIELGCFTKFSDLQISLLKSCTDILAAAINSYQSRDKISQLLDEVQEQKEALLDQQEELRQTNEALSRQAEELQASEEELKTQEEELKQINAELKERNDALENARHALSMKARELENTSRYKSEFLANMSHELRTPLNSILILAKLLADNNTGNLNAKQIEYANIVHKSGNDLLQLINDILDLSKIESGKVDLHIESTDIAGMVADLQQLFAVVATDKQIHFNIVQDKAVPASLRTDRQRLLQIIKNLLSNAFKFTPTGGNIRLHLYPVQEQGETRVAISVKDSGIGIPAGKQKLIFDAFQQADGATNRKYGGTGLGLSISRELVRLLGGSISVSSVEGKGSEFILILPIEHAGTATTTEPFTSSAQSTLTVSINEAEEQTRVSDDRNQLKEDDRLILIVEDDINFATIMRDYARHKGYKTLIALQGDEGLFYARKYQPHAIILDIQLPVMDGWSVLQQLRADERLKDIPVHIISAFDDHRAAQADVLTYMKKPIDVGTLENAFAMLGEVKGMDHKQILIYSAVHFSDEELQAAAREKDDVLRFVQVSDAARVLETIQAQTFDCLIIHIGGPIQLKEVEQLKGRMSGQHIPIIVHLDGEVSAAEEMQYRKVSDVIMRSTHLANNRLLDELELFLQKMQEVEQRPVAVSGSMLADNTLMNKKVLVVDDDMRNVFALSAMLESNKMQVIAAGDGREALEQLRRNRGVDLVLMDIMMPEMDGYEAMQQIRKEMKLTELPIIALTAKAMAGDRDKCIAAGASDYITKPVDMQKLLSLMRVWLSAR